LLLMLLPKQEYSVQDFKSEIEDIGKILLIIISFYRLFPIAVPNKLLFIEYMLSRGINAYKGAT